MAHFIRKSRGHSFGHLLLRIVSRLGHMGSYHAIRRVTRLTLTRRTVGGAVQLGCWLFLAAATSVNAQTEPLTANVALLAAAAEAGNGQLVRQLLATSPGEINRTQFDGMAAIHWSVLHGDDSLLSDLLSARAHATLANR